MINYQVMLLETAQNKYPNKNFLHPDRFTFGLANWILLIIEGKKIHGWFVFSANYNKNINKTIIDDTGTYICKNMRKEGLSKQLDIEIIKYLNNKFGKSKYIFDSIICSYGGAKIWNHRISLSGNPKKHIFTDELGVHKKINGISVYSCTEFEGYYSI